ncbi:MAG TPA: hypothetical protein DCY94_00425 [Firmicutes bacterium]|nr:hypothetical protein [Bacillota bacterium]
MVLTILHQIEDEASFIYSDGDKFGGFTYRDGYILSLSKSVLDTFSKFSLGKNRRFLEVEEGYEVYLDLDTGFKHFFKDGLPSFEMFYSNNGEEVTLFSSLTALKRAENMAKVFTVGVYMIAAISYSNLLSLCLTENVSIGDKILFYNPLYGEGYFLEEGKTIKFDADNVLEDIRKSIQKSPNLDNVEKEFLYRKDLLEMATSYYEDKKSNIILLARHHNIDIEPFSQSIDNKHPNNYGLYCYGNSLYVRDYDTGNSLTSVQKRETMGHEYVHMLELGHLRYIKEAIADIVRYEYFQKSWFTGYKQAVKYTKVLMEILGRDVVASEAFALNSNSLENAIEGLLSTEDCEHFMCLMKKKPYDLDISDNHFLYEALERMYRAKFGSEMRDNGLITAILEDGDYSRTYFSKYAMSESPSYYVENSQVAFDDFCERKDIIFEKTETYSDFLEWISLSDERISRKDFYVSFKNSSGYFDYHDVQVTNEGLAGCIVFDIGENTRMCVDIQEAIAQGLAKVVYTAHIKIPKEDFISNFNISPGFSIRSLNDDMTFNYDKETNTFKVREKKYLYEFEIDKNNVHSL